MKKHSIPRQQPPHILGWIDKNLMYAQATGVLTWRTAGGVTHKHLAGDLFFPSFHARTGKARVVNVGYGKDRVLVQYHHVCWYLAHGYWPTHPIDHANRNDKDNSLCNLRPTDDTRNAYNKPSIAAFKGVTKRPGCSTYRVRISVDGKRCDLGRGFVTAEAAFDAYKEASTQLHKEFSCVERRL
jgi:hypothetical protein